MDADLHSAAKAGLQKEVLQLLVERPSDLNSRDPFGYTPLQWACQKGHVAIVEALVRAGASINVVDRWRRTPLHRAAKEGHLAVVHTLINAGAEVNARGDALWTPLHCSSFHGNVDIVRLLLARGADPTAMDQQGRTPQTVLEMGLFGAGDAKRAAIRRMLSFDLNAPAAANSAGGGGSASCGGAAAASGAACRGGGEAAIACSKGAAGAFLDNFDDVFLGMDPVHVADPDDPDNDLYQEVRLLRWELKELRREQAAASTPPPQLSQRTNSGQLSPTLAAGQAVPPRAPMLAQAYRNHTLERESYRRGSEKRPWEAVAAAAGAPVPVPPEAKRVATVAAADARQSGTSRDGGSAAGIHAAAAPVRAAGGVGAAAVPPQAAGGSAFAPLGSAAAFVADQKSRELVALRERVAALERLLLNQDGAAAAPAPAAVVLPPTEPSLATTSVQFVGPGFTMGESAQNFAAKQQDTMGSGGGAAAQAPSLRAGALDGGRGGIVVDSQSLDGTMVLPGSDSLADFLLEM